MYTHEALDGLLGGIVVLAESVLGASRLVIRGKNLGRKGGANDLADAGELCVSEGGQLRLCGHASKSSQQP